MIPTCKLRFVERHIESGYIGTQLVHRSARVLQQWWAEHAVGLGFATGETGKGEWRDVELQEEETP